MLLNLGHLVDSFSCLSHLYGHKSREVIANLIDANKLMVSYVLNHNLILKEFPDSDISQLKQKIDLKLNTIELSDGSKTVTFKLGEPVARRLLRLGYTKKNKPYLFQEKRYSKTTDVDKKLKQQEKELLTVFKSDIGASNLENIIVYFNNRAGECNSDAGGGTQNGEFALLAINQ